MGKQILVVSAERIAEELRKLLVSPHRARGVNLLLELRLAAAILPELLPMKGLPQGSPHEPSGDLWDHVLRVLIVPELAICQREQRAAQALNERFQRLAVSAPRLARQAILLRFLVHQHA